jgi:hypothetical protein
VAVCSDKYIVPGGTSEIVRCICQIEIQIELKKLEISGTYRSLGAIRSFFYFILLQTCRPYRPQEMRGPVLCTFAENNTSKVESYHLTTSRATVLGTLLLGVIYITNCMF